MEFLAAMTLTGALADQLQCDGDQLVCPLQNITCQCVVTGPVQAMAWRWNSKLIAGFDRLGQCTLTSTNCYATVEVLQSPQGLSSNVSFLAELQPGQIKIECRDGNGESYTLSFTTVGMVIEITLNIFFPKGSNFMYPLYHRPSRSTSDQNGHGSEQLLS